MDRIVLVTGGSGFIGTNLIEYFNEAGFIIHNIDKRPPQQKQHREFYIPCDIMDRALLKKYFRTINPKWVIHLAARTDLNGKSLGDYRENIRGVENVAEAIRCCRSVQRCIYTSTKLVIPNGIAPTNDFDMNPVTFYGKSKAEGEKIVRRYDHSDVEWCIVRPTSIWGPWFAAPYLGFFQAISKGLYCHPARIDPPKSFGYVGNTVFQIKRLLESDSAVFQGKVYYLQDYSTYTIVSWANAISKEMGKGEIKRLPYSIYRVVALAGDCLKKLIGIDAPITSFRLRNMATDTNVLPTKALKLLTGNLPFTIYEGVQQTVNWLNRQNQPTNQPTN